MHYFQNYCCLKIIFAARRLKMALTLREVWKRGAAYSSSIVFSLLIVSAERRGITVGSVALFCAWYQALCTPPPSLASLSTNPNNAVNVLGCFTME
jgi:hypothetical protein